MNRTLVIPAKAGTQSSSSGWTPAFAGVTLRTAGVTWA